MNASSPRLRDDAATASERSSTLHHEARPARSCLTVLRRCAGVARTLAPLLRVGAPASKASFPMFGAQRNTGERVTDCVASELARLLAQCYMAVASEFP